MEYLTNLDIQTFIMLNHWHTRFMDFLMTYATATLTWIPLYLLLTYFVVKLRSKTFWITMLCIVIMIVLTDQGSNIVKALVERLRPAYDPATVETVRLLTGKCGLYGFFSAHAANVFSLAIFMHFLFKRKRWVGIALFAWAVLVSYSRIYVGRHFPADVLVGIVYGFLVGWLMYKVESVLQRLYYNSRTLETQQ